MEVTIKTNEMLNMNMKPMIKFTKSTYKIEILGAPIPLKYLKNHRCFLRVRRSCSIWVSIMLLMQVKFLHIQIKNTFNTLIYLLSTVTQLFLYVRTSLNTQLVLCTVYNHAHKVIITSTSIEST